MKKTMTMRYERSSPGTHRYRFHNGDGGVEVVYIRKDSLPGGQAPRQIEVTIRDAADGT